MPDSTPPRPETSVNMRWLGYLGLVLGLGAVVLSVDAGSVTLMGISFPVAVPIVAAVAFVGGLLGGRFGPRPGEL